MAMTRVPMTSLFYKPTQVFNSSTNVLASGTQDGTDDWTGYVFYWPGGDLTRIALMVHAATATPVGTVQLFNVDASGGLDLASPVGAAVDTGGMVTSVIEEVSGIGQANLPAGIYGVRIVYKSGTSYTIRRGYTSFTSGWSTGTVNNGYMFPYIVAVANGGAQSKGQIMTLMMCSFGSDTEWVPVPGFMPAGGLATTGNFTDSTNPDEYGIWFSYPATVRLCGIEFPMDGNSRPDIRIAIYTGTLASPTTAYSFTSDRDQVSTNASFGYNSIAIPDRYIVPANTFIGIGLKAASAHNALFHYFAVNAGKEALLDGWWGQNATYFTRNNDAGALTQTASRTPIITLLIDGIDNGQILIPRRFDGGIA